MTTSYEFDHYDAGRITSNRPRQKNDCTVRAYAIVSNLDYDDAYDLLAEAGRKCGKRFVFRTWADNRPELRWQSFPAVKGQRRMNPVTFCQQFRRGRFIIRTAKHVAAVVNGVLYDDARMRDDRCIYGAWEFIR